MNIIIIVIAMGHKKCPKYAFQGVNNEGFPSQALPDPLLNRNKKGLHLVCNQAGGCVPKWCHGLVTCWTWLILGMV